MEATARPRIIQLQQQGLKIVVCLVDSLLGVFDDVAGDQRLDVLVAAPILEDLVLFGELHLPRAVRRLDDRTSGLLGLIFNRVLEAQLPSTELLFLWRLRLLDLLLLGR